MRGTGAVRVIYMTYIPLPEITIKGFALVRARTSVPVESATPVCRAIAPATQQGNIT